jgi:hypothetical protein
MINNKIMIVEGSQLDAAKAAGITLAESFLNAELVILLDCSGSMQMPDAPGGIARQEFADRQLRRIQGTHPGKVALICFASSVAYSPGGGVLEVGHSTALHKALEFAKIADGCGLKILVVSDGEPDDRDMALYIARQYTSKIDALYCGPESDRESGREFLRQLAQATGGQFFTSAKPAELTSIVIALLEG